MGYWIPKHVRPLEEMKTELKEKIWTNPSLPEAQRLEIYRKIAILHKLSEKMEKRKKGYFYPKTIIRCVENGTKNETGNT